MNLFQLTAYCRRDGDLLSYSASANKLFLADSFLSLPTQAAEFTSDGRIRYQLSGLLGLFGALPYETSEAMCINRWALDNECLTTFLSTLARRSALFELHAWALDHDLAADHSANWLNHRRLPLTMATVEPCLQKTCHASLRIIPFEPVHVMTPRRQLSLGVTSFLAKMMICRQSTVRIQIGPLTISEWSIWWRRWGDRFETLLPYFPSGLAIKMVCQLRDHDSTIRLSKQAGFYLGWSTLLNSKPINSVAKPYYFQRMISRG